MKRKPTKNTRGPNADETRFQAWLKERPCIAEEVPGPSIVHHCEGATFKHNKILVGHWFCIPLCEEADRVVTNGSRRKFREIYGPQSMLWRYEIIDFEKETGKKCPDSVYDAIMDWGR